MPEDEEFYPDFLDDDEFDADDNSADLPIEEDDNEAE